MSFIVKYRATKPGTYLLGGVLQSQSSRWGDRRDAETYAETVRELNAHADPEIIIVANMRRPEIYRHCSGAEAQAIGGHCPKCGQILKA